MFFIRYSLPLPNNGDRYDLSEKELVELLDAAYDRGYTHGVESTIEPETIVATYDNLSVAIPIKDSADHMRNNNNEYDYKVVKDEQWIIPANHIVCGTVEGHQIERSEILGECGVTHIGGNTKCPYCGESYYTELYSTSTAVYYPPVYKNGVNINPDMNTSTTTCKCLNCHKEFTI